MPEQETTDTQPIADSKEAVTPSVAESDSLLSQDAIEEVKTEDKELNPLTDEVPEESEGDKEEKNEVNFDEITVPEGIVIDEGFKPVAADLNLNKDQVQKLVDYKIAADKQTAEANQAEFNEVVENLQKETKKELGADYKKEMAFASRVMGLLPKEDRVELKEILNKSGVGNHVQVVKFFIAAGKAISESKFVDGKTTNDTKKRFYKNSDMNI